MNVITKTGARKLPKGEWYWINRTVIQHAPVIGVMGIAVYNVLASMANRNQECFPSQQYIADCLGYSRATINKALKALAGQGFIATVKRGPWRCCTYRLLEPRCKARETEMSNRGNRDVPPVDTNKNQLTRINNDLIVRVKKEEFHVAVTGNDFIPETREELLAYDLAVALNEPENLSWYLSLAERYPESLLRQTLSEVRRVPESAIRKNHPALFNHVLKKHVEKTHYDSGHQSRH
jgi:DNA-binding MarR family transcriptional regulator